MPKKKKDVKVENNPGLIRDTATSAIINTNSNAYEARREQIARDRNQKQIDQLQQNDIDNLKSDVAEIKRMLEKLIGGK